MSDKLREALKDLVMFLRGTNTYSTRGAHIEIDRLCGNAETALSAPQADAEPVAWRVTNRETGLVKFNTKPQFDCPFNKAHWVEEPLFTAPSSQSAGRMREGSMAAQWTYDPEAEAYYFAPMQASPPPYLKQRHVNAIIDIASDGTLAGVELIDNMPPPPSQAFSRVDDGKESEGDLCDDCPPVGYPTDKTRCLPCPRRVNESEGGTEFIKGYFSDQYAAGAKPLVGHADTTAPDWKQDQAETTRIKPTPPDRREAIARLVYSHSNNIAPWDHPYSILLRDSAYEVSDRILALLRGGA